MIIAALVAASAVVFSYPVVRESTTDFPSWMIGCWQSDSAVSERWVAGDNGMLFGARWRTSEKSVDLSVMRLVTGSNEHTVDVVILPGRVISYRATIDSNAIRYGDGDGQHSYRLIPAGIELYSSGRVDRYHRADCSSRQFAGDGQIPASLRELHERDMAAVVRSDATALVELWTDDIVALQPNAKPAHGRKENEASLRSSLQASRGVIQPLEYELSFGTILPVCHYGLEWGRYSGKARVIATGKTMTFGGELFRVVVREPDGTYKVAATMFGRQ